MNTIEYILPILKDYDGIIGMTATVIMAIIILSVLKNVKKSVHEISQPYVVLYLTKMQGDESVNYLVLENFGKRAALNITIDMNPELKVEFPKDNPFLLFIDHRISVLAPAQKIVSALPPGEYTERRYDCTISYEGDHKEIYTRKQVLDFSYTKQILFSVSPESKIAKNTEKIAKIMEESSSARNQFR